jgi:hypothetical protein
MARRNFSGILRSTRRAASVVVGTGAALVRRGDEDGDGNVFFVLEPNGDLDVPFADRHPERERQEAHELDHGQR